VSRAALILLLLAVALSACGGEDAAPAPPPPPSGPLADDGGSGLSLPQNTGVPFTFGVPVVVNRGERPVVLERIALEEPTAGLDVVGTRVAGPKRRIRLKASEYRWPPRDIDDLHAVRGFVVAPQSTRDGERGAELVFGLRATKPGRYGFGAVTVDYRVGGRRHRDRIGHALHVCVGDFGPRWFERPCPLPSEAGIGTEEDA
jgi:hypothetical protein